MVLSTHSSTAAAPLPGVWMDGWGLSQRCSVGTAVCRLEQEHSELLRASFWECALQGTSPLQDNLFGTIIYRLLHVSICTFPQDVVVMILRLTDSSKSFQIHCLSLGSQSSATMKAFSQCSRRTTSQEIWSGQIIY